MRPFNSDQELKKYLKELADKQRMERQKAQLNAEASVLKSDSAPARPGSASEESITNVQHAGVDEGGIVKLHGSHLVVLRRGRLFAARLGG